MRRPQHPGASWGVRLEVLAPARQQQQQQGVGQQARCSPPCQASLQCMSWRRQQRLQMRQQRLQTKQQWPQGQCMPLQLPPLARHLPLACWVGTQMLPLLLSAMSWTAATAAAPGQLWQPVGGGGLWAAGPGQRLRHLQMLLLRLHQLQRVRCLQMLGLPAHPHPAEAGGRPGGPPPAQSTPCSSGCLQQLLPAHTQHLRLLMPAQHAALRRLAPGSWQPSVRGTLPRRWCGTGRLSGR